MAYKVIRRVIYDEAKNIYKIIDKNFEEDDYYYIRTLYKKIKIGSKIYYAIGRGYRWKEEFYYIATIQDIIDAILTSFSYDEQMNKLYDVENSSNEIYLDKLNEIEIKEKGIITHQIDKIEHINNLDFQTDLGVNVGLYQLNAKDYIETEYECILKVELHSLKRKNLNDYLENPYKTSIYKSIRDKTILDLIHESNAMTSDVIYHNKVRLYEKIIKDNIRDKITVHIAELVVTENKLLGNIYRKEYSIIK